ncbi:MAG: carboxypeptidase-like regulatory domain-containing protein, partial [Chitinispirillaceae bacterium]
MFGNAKLYLLLFMSGIFFSLTSQTLRGKVTDENGSGIEGASVQVVNADLSTATGEDGTWNISIPLSTEPV